MTTLRTKQQIAFDGVRTTWFSDTFTEILHQQVSTQFSMDGVIPLQGVSERSVILKERENSTIPTESLGIKKEKIIGNIDGVRIPWKQAYSV